CDARSARAAGECAAAGTAAAAGAGREEGTAEGACAVARAGTDSADAAEPDRAAPDTDGLNADAVSSTSARLPPDGGGCSPDAAGVSDSMRRQAITKPAYSSGARESSLRLWTATE